MVVESELKIKGTISLAANTPPRRYTGNELREEEKEDEEEKSDEDIGDDEDAVEQLHICVICLSHLGHL